MYDDDRQPEDAPASSGSSSGGGRRTMLAAAFAALVVLMLLWLVGTFERKVGAGSPAAAERPAAGVALVPVTRLAVPAVEAAVGTVIPAYEAEIASKLTGRVVEVKVIAGQEVRAGETLVRLESADLAARLEQARAALEAATAEDEQARRDFERGRTLHAKAAMTDVDFERCETRARTAAAQLERAREAEAEARATLSYAVVTAPRAAKVVDKRVDTGDVVQPGTTLVSLYDPARMQLVGSVREALAARIQVGQRVEIDLPSLGERCEAAVAEVVPESDAASRSFSVKAIGACGPRAYKGLFGRLLIPIGDEAQLFVPRSSVVRVGQLDLVDVAQGGQLVRRIVQLGRPSADGTKIEVLSGLAEGEEVAEKAGHV